MNSGGLLSPLELDELKARNPVDQVAGRYVALRRSGRHLIGPCPICSPDPMSRDSTRFEVLDGGARWVCAVCENGGDALELVMRVESVDFREAVRRLGGTFAIDPEEAARRDAERAVRLAREAEREAARLARETAKAREIWDAGTRGAHPLLQAYFRARALPRDMIAPTLRLHEALPYWLTTGEGEPRVIHTGPAMLGIIRDNDRNFVGTHITWLAADGSGKATITAPDGSPCKAKKIRGTHKGGAIHLAPPAEVLLVGEGIETAISVAAMLPRDGQGRPLYKGRPAAAWSAVSLGNISGRAMPGSSRKHPQRARPPVPGNEPDPAQPGLLPPAWARTCVLLGDGDSDEWDTAARLVCAAKRWGELGHDVETTFAPPGQDFNDVLRGSNRE